ncbi:hypothetical protein LBMAG27_03090 [Bacteroidota bacterium]|nr:hypothetical protein LBMAG27_03090 [Bacteroidota bacterium]
MKTITKGFCLLLILSSGLLFNSQSAPQSFSIPVSKTSIVTYTISDSLLYLSAQKFKWMINLNLDSLNTILDEDILYVHSNSWIQHKQDMINDFKNGKLKLINVSITDAAIRMFGTTAIINGHGKFAGEMNGTPFDLQLGYTEVYIKRATNWYLVTRHANKMP